MKFNIPFRLSALLIILSLSNTSSITQENYFRHPRVHEFSVTLAFTKVVNSTVATDLDNDGVRNFTLTIISTTTNHKQRSIEL